jgi:hypothetical protein
VDLYEPGPAGKYLGTYDFTARDEYLKSRLMCLNRRDDGTADYTDRSPRGPQIQNTHPAYDVRPSTHPFTAEEKEAALGRLREKLGAPGGGRAALEKGWDPKAKASRRRSIRVEQRACQRLDCAEKLAAAERSRGDTEDEQQQQQIQALTQEKGAEVAALELKLSSVEIQLKDTQKLLKVALAQNKKKKPDTGVSPMTTKAASALKGHKTRLENLLTSSQKSLKDASSVSRSTTHGKQHRHHSGSLSIP